MKPKDLKKTNASDMAGVLVAGWPAGATSQNKLLSFSRNHTVELAFTRHNSMCCLLGQQEAA